MVSTWSGFDGLGPERSAQHRSVKRLRRLARQSKARSEERAFVVEGPKLVEEAQRSSLAVEEVFVTAVQPVAGIAERAVEDGSNVHLLADGVMRGAVDAVNPQPVAAIVSVPTWSTADVSEEQFVLVGVELQDPGNAGTVIRTAEAAGAAGVILCTPCVDWLNPKVVRASAGSVLRLPVLTMRFEQAIELFRAQGRPVVATVPSATAAYDRVELGRAAMLLGNEPRGLSAEAVAAADAEVAIPMEGEVESLNVAAAAAVLAFEAQRQRRSTATGRDF